MSHYPQTPSPPFFPGLRRWNEEEIELSRARWNDEDGDGGDGRMLPPRLPPSPPHHTHAHRLTRSSFFFVVDHSSFCPPDHVSHSSPSPFPSANAPRRMRKTTHTQNTHTQSLGRHGTILANDGTRRPTSDRVGFLRPARGAIRDQYGHASGGHDDQEHKQLPSAVADARFLVRLG